MKEGSEGRKREKRHKMGNKDRERLHEKKKDHEKIRKWEGNEDS